jgi:hypothetical protein
MGFVEVVSFQSSHMMELRAGPTLTLCVLASFGTHPSVGANGGGLGLMGPTARAGAASTAGANAPPTLLLLHCTVGNRGIRGSPARLCNSMPGEFNSVCDTVDGLWRTETRFIGRSVWLVTQ